MTDLTLMQWIKLGAGGLRILQENGADVSRLKADIPAAIRLAKAFAGLVHSVVPPAAAEAPATTAGPVQSATAANTQAAAAAPRLSAQAAIEHIQARGLSEAEQRLFDRASQSSG